MLFPSAVFIFLFLPLILFLYYILHLSKDRTQEFIIFLGLCCTLICTFFSISFINVFFIWCLLAVLYFAISDCIYTKKISDWIAPFSLKNIVLLAGSLFFYAWGEPLYVLLLLFSILINYAFGLWCERYAGQIKGKWIILFCVCINVAVFFVFKYMDFVFSNFNYFFSMKLPLLRFALPLGISFYTFQALSYVIDVYRKDTPTGKAERNPLTLGLYIALFPQLIAGPIVRYKTIAEELFYRKENLHDFCFGFVRFTVGLGKKMILANPCAYLADSAFNAAPEDWSVLQLWLGALAYTFQIYFDFSGYSDMAIGLGRMFGFHFPENFNYPYIARSITDFWRRWHISLSSWFRDYVYFPLGGSRVKHKWNLILNLFIVWMLTGIWHGAQWTFVLWGFFYFVLLVIEKFSGLDKKEGVWGYLYTMPCVIIAWVLFRAQNMSAAFSYLKTMFFCSDSPLTDSWTLFQLHEYAFFLLMALLCSFPILPWIQKNNFFTNYCRKYLFLDFLSKILYFSALILLFIISVSYIVKSTNNPFIYFNF